MDDGLFFEPKRVYGGDRHSPRDRSRSRSPVRRSRSRSRSPRDWKRTERAKDSGRRDRSSRRDLEKIRLYVSNIPYELRWQDLKDLFRAKAGQDVIGRVEMYENIEGKGCGAGVVEVKGIEAAEKAMDALHRHEIKGRQIVVREERDKDRQRHHRLGESLGSMGGGMGGGGSMGGGSSRMSGRSMGGGGGGGGGGMGNMGGQSMGGGMGNMGSNMGNMGGGMGMGGGMSDLAGGMNTMPSGIGNIGSLMGNIGGNLGGIGSGMGNMGGSSSNGSMSGSNLNINTQMLQQLGIEPSTVCNQVFVANLDFRVTSRKLREIFQMAGNVIQADIKIDKDGKSRGIGLVKFDHPMEGVQAISMFNGQVLYDRVMNVRMDKLEPVGSQASQLPPKLPSGLKSIGVGLGAGGNPIPISQLTGSSSLGMSQMGGIGGNSLSGAGVMGSGLGNLGPGMGSGMGNLGMGSGMGSGMGGVMGNTMGSGMGGNMGGDMGGSMGRSLTTSMSGMGGNFGGLSSGMGGMNDMGLSGSSLGGGMGSLGGGMGMGGSGGMGLGGGMGEMVGSMDSGFVGSLVGGGGGGGRASGGGGGGGGRSGGSYSRNQGPRSETVSVFVRNLPFSYTWQDLKDKFKEVGNVTFAKISMENGKSKGCGTVRFSSIEDAKRAVNLMSGARLDGRPIEVRIDKQ